MPTPESHSADTGDGAPPTPQGPVIFFDGVCGLCDRFVDFVIARDRQARYRFAPLQGKTAADRFGPPGPGGPSTVLFDEGTALHRRTDATLRILAGLGGPWRLARLLLLVPRGLRDPAYDFVAARRYRWFGRKESCRMPTPAERGRFLP